MLKFKPISLDSVNEIIDYLEYKDSRTCDSTLGSLFMWRDYYHSEFAIYNDVLYMKVDFTENDNRFIVPMGKHNLHSSMPLLEDYAKENNLPLNFVAVPKESLVKLEEYYPGRVVYESNRDMSDYLYLAEDLSELKGRRYSGQRNHINKFKKLYPDYKYVKISKDNIKMVLDFYNEYSKNMVKTMETAIEENERTMEILPLLDKFNMSGGFIEVDGKIIALSAGEIINDTLYVHIEKALKEFPGSYQMIMNEFAKHNLTEQVMYINREDDAGDPGLRTSKLSYHPFQLLDKYNVTIKD
ncbi:MAG: hypothetical protein K0S18_721 [Anaerocolumna sp.]|jgi:hypothetical protein|nr:hypothetical protein [Anaerocolumna sp.]